MIPGAGSIVVRNLRAQSLALPLVRPLVTGRATWQRRPLLLIRAEVEFDDGPAQIGWGEAAPMDGWTNETLDEVLGTVNRIRLPLALSDHESLESACPAIRQQPSLRAALEMAVLDARARCMNQPLAALLAALAGAPINRDDLRVPVQFTLGACSTEETRAALLSARADGYLAVKLKVGAAPLARDIARIETIAREFPELELRLDANGAWSLETALEALERMPVALIEQPVAPTAFEHLLSHSPPRAGRPAIAADESCASLAQADDLIARGGVDALVVKPCTLGGLQPALGIIERARAAGIAVILSNLMESAVGRRAVAHLAAAQPELHGPHGLATGAWFSRDLAPQPERIERGEWQLECGAGLGFDPIEAQPA